MYTLSLSLPLSLCLSLSLSPSPSVPPSLPLSLSPSLCLSPLLIGPAGTGKTESVKALGNQLGRFVLVFNCDETFDFQAMGRIFVGLCQVGVASTISS